MDSLINQIKTTEELFTQTLIRSISVTDDVLREQLIEENNNLQIKLNQLNELYMHNFFKEIKNSVMEYYKPFYEIKEFKYTLYDQNKKIVNVDNLAKKYRIRIPSSLNDRRLLLIFCQTLNCVIIIKDILGQPIDYINYDQEKTYNNCYQIYLNFYLDEYDKYNITYHTIQWKSIYQEPY